MIFFGQYSLQHAISHFMAHYQCERNRQGLSNQLLRSTPIVAPAQPVHRSQRLGGMLNYYHRAAA
jgi:putative transposase